jgi:hypothetical protein
MNDELSQTMIYKNISDLITELHCDYETWYAKSVKRIGLVWYILQIITTISMFLFAIISSIAVIYDFKTVWGVNLTMLMVLLPALSSALSGIILKFRLYDLWTIREQGRIAFQNLVNEGKLLLSSAETIVELKSINTYLVNGMNQIENDQQSSFFSINKYESKDGATDSIKDINEKISKP